MMLTSTLSKLNCEQSEFDVATLDEPTCATRNLCQHFDAMRHKPSNSVRVLLVLLQVVCCLAAGTRGSGSLHRLPIKLGSRKQLAAAQLCQQDTPWSPLYANIDNNLRFWAKPDLNSSTTATPTLDNSSNTTWGVTSDLVDAAIHEKDSRWSWRRIAILFEGGKPYLISNPEWPKDAGHHRILATAHVMLMVGLSRLYGAAIPDVEFVIGTSDEPTIRLDEVHTYGDRPLPLLRFCGTKHHADILVPDIHFHMRAFTANMLSLATGNSSEGRLPAWSSRRRRLFGRFAPYHRLHHPGDDTTYRQGFKGAGICTFPSYNRTAFCSVRTSFMEWAERRRVHAGVRLDVAAQPRRPMSQHAQYRYLLHLDGQSCSSRLEQLLALGSLTIKEESGYHAFYHHLLEPYTHYVPFWKHLPEEILSVLNWAHQHEKESEAIAAAGQQIALRYLNKEALRCYWLRTIQAYARLQRYKPGLAGGRNYKWHMPAEEWLTKGAGAAFVRNWQISVEV